MLNAEELFNLVMAEKLINLFQVEPVEAGYYCLISKGRRDHHKSFFLALCIHNEPCFVVTVEATPFGIREEMRTCAQQD